MLYLELAFTNTKRNIGNYIFPFHVIVIGAKKTICVESFHSHFGEWKPCDNGGHSYVLLEMFTYGSDSLNDLCLKPQPLAKMLRHSNEKPSLFTSNLCYSNFCATKYSTPPYYPFKVVPPIFEHDLVSLATLKRGDHKHKIMARPLKPKKGTVALVFFQLVVAIMPNLYLN